MLPIRLRFSGLNSYREEQALDFTPMANAGVFGIFGPTGAGKSTILDAITLALYGEVTRSKNKAQGVINMQEKQAYVCYTFQLGESTYQVERVLVREKDKEFSARVKSCRLVRLDDGAVIASDKTDLVNAAVIDLIGLKSEDFLRSVALPQGQFDKFLRLGAAERSKMLESLFGLERYGVAFQEKIKGYLELLTQKAEENRFILEQLGDCSPQRLKEENKLLEQQKNSLEQQRAVWQKDQQALQAWEALAQKDKERAGYEKQLQVLDEQKEAVTANQQQLALAEKTEPLRRQIDQISTDFMKLNQLKAALSNQRQAWQAMQRQLQQTEEAAALCKKTKDQHYDGWLTKLQALKTEKETTQKAEQLKQALRQQEQTLQALQAQQEQLERQKQLLAQSQQQNKEEKAAIARALQQQKSILLQKPQLEAGTALFEAYQNSKQLAEAQQTELQKQQQKCAALFAKIKSLDTTLQHCNTLEEIQTTLQGQLAAATKAYQQAKQAEKQQAAAALADVLLEGEACPVCGSTHHPQLAGTAEPVADTANAEKAYNRFLQINSQFEALAATYQEENRLLLAERQPQARQATEAAQQHLTEWQSWGKRQGITGIAALAETIRQAEAAVTALEEQGQTNNSQQEALAVQQQQLQQQEIAFTQTYSAANNRCENTKENLKNLGALRSLAEVEADLQTITKEKDQLLQTEKQLQQDLERLRPLTNRAEQEYHSLSGQHQSLLQAFIELKAELEKACRSLGFESVNQAKAALRTDGERAMLQQHIEAYKTRQATLQSNIAALQGQLEQASFQPELGAALKETVTNNQKQHEEAIGALANQQAVVDVIAKNQEAWQTATKQRGNLEKKGQTAKQLQAVVKGGGLVNFLAQEYLNQVLMGANQYLADFSNGRFSLELHQLSKVAGQEFMLRDAFNGGQCRPINTMSGGEIFLASLSLALALSTHIQLHGKYELGFFFLDEGFGTLDPEKLETLMNAVEKLPVNGRLVGVITHVAEVKNRLPYYWQVSPATISSGSKIHWGTN